MRVSRYDLCSVSFPLSPPFLRITACCLCRFVPPHTAWLTCSIFLVATALRPSSDASVSALVGPVSSPVWSSTAGSVDSCCCSHADRFPTSSSTPQRLIVPRGSGVPSYLVYLTLGCMLKRSLTPCLLPPLPADVDLRCDQCSPYYSFASCSASSSTSFTASLSLSLSSSPMKPWTFLPHIRTFPHKDLLGGLKSVQRLAHE